MPQDRQILNIMLGVSRIGVNVDASVWVYASLKRMLAVQNVLHNRRNRVLAVAENVIIGSVYIAVKRPVTADNDLGLRIVCFDPIDQIRFFLFGVTEASRAFKGVHAKLWSPAEEKTGGPGNKFCFSVAAAFNQIFRLFD